MVNRKVIKYKRFSKYEVGTGDMAHKLSAY